MLHLLRSAGQLQKPLRNMVDGNQRDNHADERVNLQHLSQCFVLKKGHSVAVFVQRFVDAEHDEGCQNGLYAPTCLQDRFLNSRKDFEQKREKQHINGNNGIGNMLYADVFNLFFFFVAAQIFHRQ